LFILGVNVRIRKNKIPILYNRQWMYEPNVNSPSIYLNIQGGLSDSPYWMTKRPGILAPIFNWESVES